jgi:arsenate reductase
MVRIYTYAKCDTCRKAVKFLRTANVAFEEIPIREQPPSIAELWAALDAAEGNLRSLFNTSGVDYRALEVGKKLPKMTPDAALALLTSNGNLVKRPFAIGLGSPRVGFREAEWTEILKR